MHISNRLALVACAWMGAMSVGHADEAGVTPCDLDAVAEHVREQIRIYGPQSQKREYFAFVYRFEGRVASAVTRGNECKSRDRCTTDTELAARQIPKGAQVLGEWHTHPLSMGSRSLSAEDVKGAHQNRNIRCYTPYYSTPAGEIYSWDASKTSVPTAMNSRVPITPDFSTPIPTLAPTATAQSAYRR